MTCKDCIHCRACHEMYLVAVSQEDDFFEVNDADTCEDFKHKYSFVEVKHGTWLEKVNSYNYSDEDFEYLECSVCGNCSPFQYSSPYCSECGAKMDGERKENE